MTRQGREEETLNSKFFGMPKYQPFSGGRSFDYEQKYPPDPLGEEARGEARVWATYLDEAESYDHDMIQSFRDTIDSLLVLAGLFSAIVAAFVVQTSQALKPNFAQLALSVQLEHVALLRAGGNMSAMASIPSSSTTIETSSYTCADLWVNGLFFTSLSLSMATALLAVLVKQWCQAYTTVTSGSARDKALIRQFRFDGVQKWKLPEIVGSLPLLLHVSFVVFFAGLSFFVYDIHPSLSSTVIIVMILSLSGYLITLILPALWLECPYRIPLLFRPSRFMVCFFGLVCKFLGYSHNAALPAPLRSHLRGLPVAQHQEQLLLSLKDAEQSFLRQPSPFLQLEGHTLRIVSQALYGYITDRWVHVDTNGEYYSFFAPPPVFQYFLEHLPIFSLVDTALHSLEPASIKAPTLYPNDASLDPLTGLLGVLSYLHKEHGLRLYIPVSTVSWALIFHLRRENITLDKGTEFLRWGANLNFEGGIPLHEAAASGNTHNMKWLLENGARVDEHDLLSSASEHVTTLMQECASGNLDNVKFLTEAGANVNLALPLKYNLSHSPLTMTVRSEDSPNLDIISFLIDNGAEIDQGLRVAHDTVLYRAIRSGHVEAIRLLLHRGAEVNELCYPRPETSTAAYKPEENTSLFSDFSTPSCAFA
ncbi:hypothetical protein DL96DRAFT_1824072 [Flagelloscypha sp. PMI_526]|nr:hypothetical protein DL96DRAFT_1824072 [Flagelloscypha sp. PMI_526]